MTNEISEHSASLKTKARNNSFWAILGELIAGATRALGYFIYALLLTPSDFGVVGFALIFINAFPLVVDNSLGLALIRGPDTDEAYSTIFYLNILAALVSIGFLSAISPFLVALVHESKIVTVLPILGIQLLFNALCSVHIAIARKRFQYKKLVPVRIVSSIVSLCIGIPMAREGFGYWSLIVSSLVGALGQMVAVMLSVPWRPKWVFKSSVVREMSGFTTWVFLDMSVTWLLMSGASFFLAIFLGVHDLGLFRLSDRLDTYFLGAVFTPLITVLYSTYCECVRNRVTAWDIFERSSEVISLAVLMLSGILIVIATPFSEILTQKWAGIGFVIMLNAGADGIGYLTVGVPSLLRAHGHAKAIAVLRICAVGAQILIYTVLAKIGILAFLWGKIAIEIGVTVGSYVMLWQVFRVSLRSIIVRQIGYVAITAAAIGVALGAMRVGSFTGPFFRGTVGLVVFCLPMLIVVWAFERESVMEFVERVGGRWRSD